MKKLCLIFLKTQSVLFKAFVLLIAFCLIIQVDAFAERSNRKENGSENIAEQQTKTVSGIVKDESNMPLPGVTVVVKGTTKGTITDVDGNFTFVGLKPTDVLLFSFIGMDPLEMPVGSQTTFSISMKTSSIGIEEVVAVGYGVQKKASLTSAISQIKADEALKNKGINNVSVALQGEIPGLVVTRTSTRPGSEGAEMKIRGDISVNGNSSPLVLIDGIAGSLDELNQMEPSDIENITVLKDASAAIYGARSASGVLLVTTKRGKKGGARITYNGAMSTTIDGIKMPITTNAQWLDMFYGAQYHDAMANNPTLTNPDDIKAKMNWWIFATNNVLSGTLVDTGESIGDEQLWQALHDGRTMSVRRSNGWIHRYEPNNYMQDELYGQGMSYKHSISISGADDKFGYRASIGYADNQSQLKVVEDGEKKYSGRLNMDYQATNILKFETGMSYEMRNITTPSTDVGAGWADPWYWSFYSKTGNFYDTFDGKRSPLGGLIAGGQAKTGFITFRSNLKATLDLAAVTEGLSLSVTGGYKTVEKNIQTSKNKVQYYDWEDNMTGNKQGPGSLTEEMNKWTNTTLGAFADYQRKFGEVHNVSAMVGVTSEEEDWKKVTASRSMGPLYEGSGLVDLETMVSGTNNGAGGGQSSWAFLSFITRLNYNYGDRYIVEFLGRRDGSSKLALKQRWKNFYSVSGAWVVSNESFMKDLTWMNNLKVRYNYGKTGSVTGIDNYERYALLKTGTAYFGQGSTLSGQPSVWLNGMTSDERTWETINSHDVGVDFGFLKNRLSGSFDYFKRTNEGMFIQVSYPAVLGANAPLTNNGKFGAKGWEFALNWKGKIGELTYNVGGFIGDAKNKVIQLANNENVPNPGKNENRLVGKPRESYYVYETAGIFSTQQEADAYYEEYYWNDTHTGPKSGNILPAPQTTGTNRLRPGAHILVDRDGDGAITTKDTYYAGDAAPHHTFGFKLGAEFKGFDFQAFFQGVGKQTVLRTGNLRGPFTTVWSLQNSTYLGKTWTEDNQNSDYTVLSFDGGFNQFNYDNKDVSVQHSSYVRLKSLVIGYTIPKHLIQKAGLSQLRVYVSGDDLWEWTKIKDGYDPEYGEQSNNTFPFSRLLSTGVNISF